jgi:CRISPR/Cas system-associated exonuclease Cas4 (RecB family)
MNKKIVLSASSLNLYLDCPRCFWLQINRALKRPRGPFPSIATGLDSVVKKYFDNYRKSANLPPLLSSKIKARLIDSLPKTFWYNADVLNASLMGKLDECIIDEEGFYLPLDHKTRASVPESTHPAYRFQMSVYTLLLIKNNYNTKNVAYLVYYAPDAGVLHEGFPFTVEVKEVKTDPCRAEKVFNEAVSLLRNDMPQSSERCEFCNWARQVKPLF